MIQPLDTRIRNGCWTLVALIHRTYDHSPTWLGRTQKWERKLNQIKYFKEQKGTHNDCRRMLCFVNLRTRWNWNWNWSKHKCMTQKWTENNRKDVYFFIWSRLWTFNRKNRSINIWKAEIHCRSVNKHRHLEIWPLAVMNMLRGVYRFFTSYFA